MSLAQLKNNRMMARMIHALDEGRDVGHYGRLVFAIIGRHFLSDDELVSLLARDRDFAEADARGLVHQVTSAGYSPPRPEKIRDWQGEQDFQILPDDDPDAGNVYRDLQFPDEVYESISAYHKQKV